MPLVKSHRILLPVILIAMLLSSGTAQAATPLRDAGLLITPVRQYPKVDAGSQQTGSFSVANLTGKNLTVNLLVKQFSVSNYVYDYRFVNTDNSWLHLGATQIVLIPNASRTIAYSVIVPPNTTPGGYYYTLLASASVASGTLGDTIQAATLLYITVNGKLIESTRLQSSSMSHISFGPSISYSLDAADTGNVHYFSYVSGQLHGPFVKTALPPTTHLLMPQTVRRLSGSIPTPVFPGIYRATYGYTTDVGQRIMRSQLIVFVPPWSIAMLLGCVLLADVMLRRRRKAASAKKKSTAKGGDDETAV